jgi:predicted nucleic acid-binding protein
MPAPDFLDTNILIYGYDITDPRKQRTAQSLIRKALAGEIITSTQVIAEFAAALLHKVVPPARPKDLLTILDALQPIRLIPPDGDTIRRAVEARQRYGIHFYDGMIIAAAERAGCKRIWSEAFNSGQRYFSVVAQNPFA